MFFRHSAEFGQLYDYRRCIHQEYLCCVWSSSIGTGQPKIKIKVSMARWRLWPHVALQRTQSFVHFRTYCVVHPTTSFTYFHSHTTPINSIQSSKLTPSPLHRLQSAATYTITSREAHPTLSPRLTWISNLFVCPLATRKLICIHHSTLISTR